ncbi:GNAT family N-acetyltransferase [Bacillus thuringiensis serovar medellin]|uniref:GNAT family N-acetyltransferase n=1 Tax=Bacillus thuringiensis subsp. medellin TaxID=79672 RepID=A0A9X6RF20_BACTV|nr:GNAT family N-acetyltransferase [Bacillus thuringiensis]OUB96482.1 GNAT family N-acetyltransferase [Bacillus thuringiensis serovar medellin]
MMTHIVESMEYIQIPDDLRHKIAIILHRTWPNICPMPEEVIPDAHEKELKVRSFYICIDEKLVSYTGVVRKTIIHNGQIFNIAGLSCVTTDPDYRGQGIGLQTVATATQWIKEQSDIDFGIFTCEPSLADFYKCAGAWSVAPDITLIGSKDEKALSSEHLGVVVLMRFFSEKSKENKLALRNTTINLDFPVGQFL